MTTDTLNVVPITVPGQQAHHGKPYPLVLACRPPAAGAPGVTLDATAAWVAANRDALLRQSAEHGSILFRGFPLATAEDFDRFVAAFGL